MKPVDFDIYCKETPVVRVQFDDAGQPQFAVLNNRCLPVLLYGMDGKAAPNAKRLDRFIADRCFPRTRQNADKPAGGRRWRGRQGQADLPQNARRCGARPFLAEVCRRPAGALLRRPAP